MGSSAPKAPPDACRGWPATSSRARRRARTASTSTIREYASFRPTTLAHAWPAGLTVTGYPVTHVPATNPHALRIEVGGKVIVFSGDTAWDDNLIDAAAGADIFICEAWSLRPRAPVHLDIETLRARRSDIDCERIILTHMGDDVLAALPIEGFDAADDGMVVEV